MIYHREVGAAESGRDVGDTSSGGSSGGIRDAVSGHIHWAQAGDDIPIGGVATYF